MASTINRFGALAIRHSFRTRPQTLVRSAPRPAFFHQSSIRRDEDCSKPAGAPREVKAESSKQRKQAELAADSTVEGDEAEIVNYGEVADGSDPFWGFPNTMSMAERERIKKEMQNYIENPPEENREQIRAWRREVAALEQKYLREWEDSMPPDVEFEQPKEQEGLLGMGEDHPDDRFADPEDEGDDIHSKAHGDLEQHREIREYMRIASWEMPLLSQYARKYEPPSKEYPLRFRHTTYMGETHPAQQKIVLEFCTADLPLTNAERLKLIKLVGVRYDPRKDLVKMSCEMFETAAQNKRYLGDLVDTLMLEAKNQSNAEGAKDKFEDVPPDFRHVKFKRRLAFPSAWKITPERQAALEAERTQRALAEQDRMENGRLVTGPEVIESAMQRNQGQVAQVLLEQQRAGLAPTPNRPTA